MSCRIPVIAVNADAPAEMIDTGKEGILVENNDTDFASAILELIANPNLRYEMGLSARLRAESISADRCTNAC